MLAAGSLLVEVVSLVSSRALVRRYAEMDYGVWTTVWIPLVGPLVGPLCRIVRPLLGPFPAPPRAAGGTGSQEMRHSSRRYAGTKALLHLVLSLLFPVTVAGGSSNSLPSQLLLGSSPRLE